MVMPLEANFRPIRCLGELGGLVTLSSDSVCRRTCKRLAAINCNLPGKIQTVPRGELYCIFLAVTLAPENSTIDFVTDNEGNFKKHNKGRDFAILIANGDIFRKIFDATRIKNISLSVRWMPSHKKDGEDLPAGVTEVDVIGNNFADIEAGKAAIRLQIDVNVSSVMLLHRNLAG